MKQHEPESPVGEPGSLFYATKENVMRNDKLSSHICFRADE